MENIPHAGRSELLTRDSLALIMAGGRGTRLQNLTRDRAKPAVYFGGQYRIIDFTLSNCINSGIRRMGVLTQYESHCLIRHLQHGWSFLHRQLGEFIELLPAEQRQRHSLWYSGTADAVYQNIEFIRIHRPRYVLVLAGDHIYKMDYGAMLAHHVDSRADVTLGCVEVPAERARDFGVVTVDDGGRVIDFVEKPARPEVRVRPGEPCLVSMGIYVFNTEQLLDQLSRDAGCSASAHDFGHNILPEMVDSAHVQAFPFRDLHRPDQPGYWRDVGTVDGYWKANQELLNSPPELDLDDGLWPVWTHRQQLPPARFVRTGPQEPGLAEDSLVSQGCVIAGGRARRSILFTHARMLTGSRVEQSLLLPGVSVGPGCVVHRAIIDAGCSLPEGTVIGVDAEADAQRYHRTPEGITLVTRHMLVARYPHRDRPRSVSG